MIQRQKMLNNDFYNLVYAKAGKIISSEAKSTTTSRVGGMRMALGKGRGHFCWWPLIFKPVAF